MTDPLNHINYLNLAGYIINVLVTFGASPIFDFPDNAELSERYSTLVTPAGWTFAIWGVIFIFQGIFTVCQMLPDYRSLPMVQDGVNVYYFAACLAQSAWTFAFGYEAVLLSVFFMVAILASLVKILLEQIKIEANLKDFWLLKFPFEIHCGWIFAAFAVNVNAAIVAGEGGASAQMFWAVLSLLYVLTVTVASFIYKKESNFTIPSVLAWASLGIAIELNKPGARVADQFEEAIIKRIQFGVYFIFALILAGIAYFAYLTQKKKKEEADPSYQGEKMTTSDAIA